MVRVPTTHLSRISSVLFDSLYFQNAMKLEAGLSFVHAGKRSTPTPKKHMCPYHCIHVSLCLALSLGKS